MNVFHKVTLESLRKNRTRTAVTIVGITLSAALLTAVTTSVSSLSHYLIEGVTYQDGKWHSSACGWEMEDYRKLCANEEVTDAAYLQTIGYAAIDSTNENKPYLYIAGISGNFTDLVSVHVVEGTLPASGDELMIPEHLATNGGVVYHVGDTVTLEIGQRIGERGEVLLQSVPNFEMSSTGEDTPREEHLENAETRTFTICGICERPEFEPFSAPGYTCLTAADAQERIIDMYYTVKHPRNIYRFMEDTGIQGNTHTDLLMLLGVSRFSGYYQVVYGMAGILILLIMFGSVALIYNAFAISVSERTKQFGLLSSVGATKKQLRRMVRFESLCVSAVGIPLGILVGIVGITVTFLAIGSKFTIFWNNPVPMRMHVSWGALAVSLLVSLVTVLISAWIPSVRATKASAVEAIRQTADVKAEKRPVRTPKWIYKLFGLPGMLAHKYFRRSRRKYRATILSLFMSVVLFISSSAFTMYLTESVTGVFRTADYDIRYWIEPDECRVTFEELTGLIRECPHVTEAAGGVCMSVPCNVDKNDMDPAALAGEYYMTGTGYEEPGRLAVFPRLCFVTDDTYRAFLAESGLSEAEYMDPDAPLGVAVNRLRVFDEEREKSVEIHFMKEGPFEMRMARERQIEGFYVDGFNGDTVVYRKIGDELNTVREIPKSEALVWKTLQVGATVDQAPWFIDTEYAMTVLYPMCVRDTVMKNMDPNSGNWEFGIRAEDHKTAFDEFQRMLTAEGIAGNAYDVTEEEENNRNLVTIVRVFSGGFIVLISLIAAANVFNSISTNVALRRREFAMLKSVGMTDRGLMGMMNYECVLYGTRALLFGLPVSFGMTLLIYRTIHSGFETGFSVPWGAVGTAVLSVFAVVFVTMLYAMRKVRQENPIDALKNENL